MCSQSDAYPRNFLQAADATPVVGLHDDAPRVAAEVLPDVERHVGDGIESGDDVEGVAERTGVHRCALGVGAELSMYVALNPVEIVGTRQAFIVGPALGKAIRMTDWELEGGGRLHQPVEVLGVGLKPAGLDVDLPVLGDDGHGAVPRRALGR